MWMCVYGHIYIYICVCVRVCVCLDVCGCVWMCVDGVWVRVFMWREGLSVEVLCLTCTNVYVRKEGDHVDVDVSGGGCVGL